MNTKLTKIDQEKCKIEKNLHLEPCDYQIYCANIDVPVRHQYGISVTESQTFFLAKRPQWRGARRNGCFRSLSRILGFGIWNWARGIQNLSNDWNPKSKFYWQWIHNTVLGIWNPQRWIQNPRLSWITLHGTIIFRTAHHVVFWCSPCKHQLCRYSEGNF